MTRNNTCKLRSTHLITCSSDLSTPKVCIKSKNLILYPLDIKSYKVKI